GEAAQPARDEDDRGLSGIARHDQDVRPDHQAAEDQGDQPHDLLAGDRAGIPRLLHVERLAVLQFRPGPPLAPTGPPRPRLAALLDQFGVERLVLVGLLGLQRLVVRRGRHLRPLLRDAKLLPALRTLADAAGGAVLQAEPLAAPGTLDVDHDPLLAPG